MRKDMVKTLRIEKGVNESGQDMTGTRARWRVRRGRYEIIRYGNTKAYNKLMNMLIPF